MRKGQQARHQLRSPVPKDEAKLSSAFQINIHAERSFPRIGEKGSSPVGEELKADWMSLKIKTPAFLSCRF